MAKCIVCNAEFDPIPGAAERYCAQHQAQAVARENQTALGLLLGVPSLVGAVLLMLYNGLFLLAFVTFIGGTIFLGVAAAKESVTRSPIKPAMICPHCHQQGSVSTYPIQRKTGISGGKATAAVLTGGVSLLATGLSRQEAATKAHCSNCGVDWVF